MLLDSPDFQTLAGSFHLGFGVHGARKHSHEITGHCTGRNAMCSHDDVCV